MSEFKLIGAITRLYVKNTGEVLIGTDGDEKLSNCTAVSDVYLSLPYEINGYNSIYSVLLAAKMSNSPVQVRIREQSDRCEVIYVNLD